ncbi:MAG TPA: nitroreductase [Polyangia bacterium]|jgi:nitroreductase|nr:nitroreductase [Polyangia bacterium]
MNLDAWNLDAAAFPARGSDEEKLTFAARCAILAPSSHNSQPWRFFIHGNRLDLKADRTRALPVVDPDHRELVISCGAALFHLRLALRYCGYEALVERSPACFAGDVLATVRIGRPRERSSDDEWLFAAIPRRHTNRTHFSERAVDGPLRMALLETARAEGAWLYATNELTKEVVAALVAEGDRLQSADPRFRDELAKWLHPNRGDDVDGMPGSTRSLSDVGARLAPLLVRTFEWSGTRAAHDHELAVGSPLLAVLGTPGDGERDWLRAGEALAHVLLRATSAGLAASFLNQPVEVPRLRRRLHETLGQTGWPQLVLRLGYGATVPPTPRRPLQDVVQVTR